MKRYLRNLTLALDRFLNVLLFCGKPDETISQHTAYAKVTGKKWACVFCKFLHWVDHRHCDKVFTDEPTSEDAGLRFFVLLFIVLLILYFAPLLILR
jgi:hypothetical protein